MEEIWKDIEGWASLYQISNLGRVRSLDRYVPLSSGGQKYCKGQILVLRRDKDGYCIVHLRDASTGRNKMLKVHRLVANAFIPFVRGKNLIDHINGIRDDNRVDNLRWCTCKENLNFPIARINNSNSTRESYNRHPELRKIRAKIFSAAVSMKVLVKKTGVVIGCFDSQKDAAKQLGFAPSTISAFMTGKLKVPNGYEFIRLT